MLAAVDEGDEEGDVRKTLALRTTYPKVLAKIASQPFEVLDLHKPGRAHRAASDWSLQEYIRSDVARNPHTPPEILNQFADLGDEKDSKGWIRMGLVENPNVPNDVLEKLAKLRWTGRAFAEKAQKILDKRKKEDEEVVKYGGTPRSR